MDVIDVDGPGRLATVARQLWAPLLADGARVALVDHDASWRTVETYRVVPDAGRARMLVPDRPRLAAAALSAYPGLRPAPVRLARGLAAGLAGLGVPPGLHRVHLQVPAGAPDPDTPLRLAARATGRDGVGAAVGVRVGANAKPTLQLFAPEPVGFVKLAWEGQSTGFVRRESSVLAQMAGVAGPVRVPRVLAAGTWGEHPYLVTEPLPPDVHRPGPHEAPTPAELLGLAPVVREDRPGATAHLRTVAGLLAASTDPRAAALLAEARGLAATVLADERPVPVVARWHGDLVPWNVARGSDGALWVWDWETAEDDVVIGLDAVHWTLHAPARVPPEQLAGRLVERLPGLRAVLGAMGAPAHAVGTAVAVHVLAMVARGLGLAAARGGWDRVLVGPEPLRALVAAADRVTSHARP